MRTLIAGVGYQNLRDLSVGSNLVAELQQLEWPEETDVEDWSFTPIFKIQGLREQRGHYDRLVFITAVERGREPATVRCYRWPGSLPGDEEIQVRVGQALGGVISLDNLLIIAQRFDALPEEVFVVEIEPVDTGWGPGFSPEVEDMLGSVITSVQRLAWGDGDG